MITRKKRILCVDDNPADCKLIKTYLGMADYEVITAITAAEGLRLAQSQQFDLYLLEFSFPDGTGLGLAQQIQTLNGKTPLVFHSASAYAKDIQQGLDAGAQAYITKPSDPDTVVKTVTTLIADAEKMEISEPATNKNRKTDSYSSSRAIRWPRP